jgi:hypothetical protein
MPSLRQILVESLFSNFSSAVELSLPSDVHKSINDFYGFQKIFLRMISQLKVVL